MEDFLVAIDDYHGAREIVGDSYQEVVGGGGDGGVFWLTTGAREF